MVYEVSIVDKGANQKSFMLLKNLNAGDKSMKEDLIKRLAKVTDSELKDLDKYTNALKSSKLDETDKSIVEATMKLAGYLSDKVEPEVLKSLFGISGLLPEPEIVTKEVSVTKETPKEDILKSATEPIQKAFGELETKNAEIEKKYEVLSKAFEEDRDRQGLAKIDSLVGSFKNLSIQKSEISPLLYKIQKDLGDSYLNPIMSVLKTADASLKGLYREIGSGLSDDASDSYAKIQNMAKELASKENITVEKAEAKILDANPGLYSDHISGGK